MRHCHHSCTCGASSAFFLLLVVILPWMYSKQNKHKTGFIPTDDIVNRIIRSTWLDIYIIVDLTLIYTCSDRSDRRSNGDLGNCRPSGFFVRREFSLRTFYCLVIKLSTSSPQQRTLVHAYYLIQNTHMDAFQTLDVHHTALQALYKLPIIKLECTRAETIDGPRCRRRYGS